MRTSKLVFVGIFAVFAALMAAYPVFPPLARQLGLSELQTGILISLSALLMLLASPVWGRLSDKWGRKAVFLTGLFGVAVSLLMFAAVVEVGLTGAVTGAALFGLLIVTRIPLGLTAAATTVSAQAHVADTTDAENRSAGMAMIGVGNALGLIVGPALAAGLVIWGLLMPFYVGAAFLIVVAAMTAYRMPNLPAAAVEDAVRLRLLDDRVRLYLLVGLCAVITISVLQVTVGFLMIDRLGLSVEAAAQYAAGAFFIAGLGLVVVQGAIIPKLKLAPKQLMRVGVPTMAVGTAVLVWAPEIWSVYGAFALVAVGAGLTFPGYQAAVTLAVEDAEQGAVAGLTGVASAAGAIIGPLLGTLIYQSSPGLTYIAIAALLVILSGVVWRGTAAPTPA